jgi:hypothetical protein
LSGKKSLSKGTLALAALAMVALIALVSVSYVYFQQNATIQDNNQIASLQTQAAPKLVSIGLNYTDNRADAHSLFLHVTGYAVNVGGAKANNCTIHVNAIQNGNVTAIDTTATINSLDAGAYEQIDLQFPYTGQPLVAYSSYLEWST